MNMVADHGDDDDVEVEARDRIGHAVVRAKGFFLCARHFSRATICAGPTFSLPAHLSTIGMRSNLRGDSGTSFSTASRRFLDTGF
jgi:hypothetical protein